MAFKYINAAISGEYQKILSRLIEDPDTIDLTDTPSYNLPLDVPQTGQNVDDILTGSIKSIKFDGVNDFIKLPTTGGLGTEILLEDIGTETIKHGSSANNFSLEAWIKLDSTITAVDKNSEFFEVTLQRNSASTTTGYDGNYMARTIYAVSGQASVAGTIPNPVVSAHFIDFQFATGSNFAYSLTSNNNITVDEWHHIWCEYSVTGAVKDPAEHMALPLSPSWMRIYIDGALNRETWPGRLQELASDDAARTEGIQASTLPFPSTGSAVTYGYDRSISFDGKLDEMRLWLNTGTTNSISTLANAGNIGIAPNDFTSPTGSAQVKLDFAPSGEYLAAWWRFENLSAAQLFAAAADSITDLTNYGHSGTPINFAGSIDFSEEETIVAGAAVSGLENAAGEANASGNLFRLTGGVYDHGGMSVIHDNQSELKLEQGVDNLVTCASNVWSASAGAIVTPDILNIFYGSSAYTINTNVAGQGALHTIDYSHLFFEKNDYTLSLRLLLSTGSPSAQVTFTLGDKANRVATTAIMDKKVWQPVVIRNTATLPTSESTITGEISILGLTGAGVHHDGALFKVDGLQIHEGSYPSAFVGPQQIRKGGEISWDIGE